MSLELVCVNYGNVRDAQKVILHCKEMMKFDKASIFHPSFNLKSIDQNTCWIKEMPDLITCDHVLSVHWDGFIINPEMWDDSWLQYDWIGAPWCLTNLANEKWRVGCGGFSLMSKRIIKTFPDMINPNEPLDWHVAALQRNEFEDIGMRFAPLDVAMKFAKECECDDLDMPEGAQFGFHSFEYGGGYREKYRKQVYSTKE